MSRRRSAGTSGTSAQARARVEHLRAAQGASERAHVATHAATSAGAGSAAGVFFFHSRASGHLDAVRASRRRVYKIIVTH